MSKTIIVCTIDFETFKIEGREHGPPVPVGVAIYEPLKDPVYLAWGHPENNNSTKEQAMAELRRVYSLWPILCQNTKFDFDVSSEHMGLPMVPPHGFHETMFVAYLNNPHEPTYSLKPMSEKYLNMPPDEQDAVFEYIRNNVFTSEPSGEGEVQVCLVGKPEGWHHIPDSMNGAFIAYAPGDLVGQYAIGDVVRTKELFDLLYPKIIGRGMGEAYQLEIDLMPILLRNEREGVRVDAQGLRDEVARLEADLVHCNNWLLNRLGDINLDSGHQVADAMDRLGVVTEWKKTPKGKRSTKKDDLEECCTDLDLVNVMRHRNILIYNLRTFCRPWLKQLETTGGRIHTRWNQVRGEGGGARSNRLCVVGDAKVLVPGGYKNMKDVRPGDLVFSFVDDKFGIGVRKVTWAGATGVRPTVKIHWVGGRRDREGTLEVTANHPVRMVGGGYVAAEDLVAGDSVCAISRGVPTSDGYSRLYATGNQCLRENRVVFESVHGHLPEHVHHINGDKLDDRPENLEGMPAAEHAAHHSKEMWQREGFSPNLCRGGAHYMHREVTRRDAIRALLKAKGSILHATRILNMDFDTFKKKLVELDVKWKKFQARYPRKGSRRLVKGHVLRAREIHETVGADAARKYIGLGYYPWRELQESFGHIPYNHTIEKVVPTTSAKMVYDIEVEGSHNFIVNELCVHNSSSPNFQNVPNPSDVPALPQTLKDLGVAHLPFLRNQIIPDNGESVIIGVDYAQQEIRVLANIEKGALFRAYLNDPSLDPYIQSVNTVKDATGVEISRQAMKVIYLALLYGMGIASLAKSLKIDVALAREFLDVFLAAQPDIAKVKRNANRGRHIITWKGRIHPVELPKIVNGKMRSFEYKLLNAQIQGSSAEMTKQAMTNYDKKKVAGRIVLSLHDELIISCPKNHWESELAILKESMQDMDFGVPLRTDAAMSDKSWGEMVDL